MYCKYCGKEISENEKFCKSCGKKLVINDPKNNLKPVESSSNSCINCGNKLAPGLKFCNMCGKQINNVENNKEKLEKEIYLVQKKSKTKRVSLVAMIAVFAMLIGIASYIAFSKGVLPINNSNTKPNKNVSQNTEPSNITSQNKEVNNSNSKSSSQNSDTNNNVQTNTSEYILPESNTRYLTDSEISSMSKDQLVLARNEIFARYGYVFNSKVYSDYFSSKSWYKSNPLYKSDVDTLNVYERYNASLIQRYENQ